MTDGSDPGILWHYTNTEGLKGIVETGVIWATDAEYLNDAAELRYGRDQLIEALTHEAELRPFVPAEGAMDNPEANRAMVASMVAEGIRNADDSDQSRTSGVYVACFCEEGDLLSQWRGYAAGSGFALGFNTARLREAHSKDLCRVSYGPHSLPERVSRIVAELLERPSNHPGMKSSHYATAVIPRLLAEHKHPAFREEREWRIIAALPDTDHQPVSFRSSGLGLVPYRKLDVGPALVEVRVGPGPNEALRRKAVRRLVEIHRRDVANVTGSEAPFRP